MHENKIAYEYHQSKAILLKLISVNISLNPGLRKIMIPIVRFDAIAIENIWFDMFNSF